MGEMSEESQKMAVQSLMDASEYNDAAKLANEAVTEAVARYLHDLMIEKAQRRVENDLNVTEECVLAAPRRRIYLGAVRTR
jgi:hypothetical protein